MYAVSYKADSTATGVRTRNKRKDAAACSAALPVALVQQNNTFPRLLQKKQQVSLLPGPESG
jgi:hypothetical protein